MVFKAISIEIVLYATLTIQHINLLFLFTTLNKYLLTK